MSQQETPLYRRFLPIIVGLAILSIPLLMALGRMLRPANETQISTEQLRQYRRILVYSRSYNPVPIARDKADTEAFETLALQPGSLPGNDGLMGGNPTPDKAKIDELTASGRFFFVEQNTPAALMEHDFGADLYRIQILSGPQEGKQGWIIPARAKDAPLDLR